MLLIYFQSRWFVFAIYILKYGRYMVYSLYALSMVKNIISCRVELERERDASRDKRIGINDAVYVSLSSWF
jgi:hypothetical protein